MGSQENRDGSKAFTASAALSEYRRVKLNASLQLAYAAAGEDSIGTLEGAVASGGFGATRLWTSQGTRKMVAAAAITAGVAVYGAADGKISTVIAGPVIGTALETASGDGAVIEVLPAGQQLSGSGKVYSNAADSAGGGTSSVAEFDFDKSFTFPAGDLKAGDVLEIDATVKLPATNGTDTFTGKLYVGSELIVATPAVDVANGDIGHIHARVVVREGGASGKLEATGHVALGVPGTVTAKPFFKAEAAEDLTGAIAVKVTGQFSVSNAGNSAVLQHLSIVRFR